MKKLIAGNWKMNGLEKDAVALIGEIGKAIGAEDGIMARCDFLVCPPFVHIHLVKKHIDHGHMPVDIGAQDCSPSENGAYTGDVSAAMISDLGCRHVILGHSERRHGHGETSADVKAKAEQAHASGLVTVICVGEQEAERDAGRENEVVKEQLFESIPDSATADNLVIAYEPVWAIGTGKTASPEDVAAMHGFIRDTLQEKLADSTNIRILYGGSVKPDNAAALFVVENVDGALIGGASLKADQFIGIAKAA